MKCFKNFKILLSILKRDVFILRRSIFDEFIDGSIIVTLQYLMYAQFLPYMGMDKRMVAPIFFGTLCSVLLNGSFDRALRDSQDLEYFRFIDYLLTLPISINWLIARYIIRNFINSCVIIGCILFYALFVFSDFLDLSQAKLLPISFLLFLSILLFSTLLLLIIFALPYRWVRDNIWPRVLSPASLLGCLYFPFKPAFAINPLLASISLLSPLTYAVEGFRSAFFNSPNFIDYNVCIIMLLLINICNIAGIYYFVPKRLELS